MKQVMICSAALALTLFVAPSFADNWERQMQMRQQDRVMAYQNDMDSDREMHNRYGSVEEHRRIMLERGGKNSVDYIDTMYPGRGGYATTPGVRSIEDIENLPSTAAGYPERGGRTPPEERRRGHRGGIDHEF